MCEKLKLKDILGEEYGDGEVQEYLELDYYNTGVIPYIEVDGIDDMHVALDITPKVKMTKALDRWRKSRGELPLFYDDNSGELDYDSWYEMRISIHQSKDVELYFWVESYSIGDQIDFELTKKEKESLWEMADIFVKCELNCSLDELFKEEEDNIREYYESQKEDNNVQDHK